MNIREILKAFIKSKHISQKEFAESIGMQKANFNKYFTANTKPSFKTLEKINKVYPDFRYDGLNIIEEPPMVFNVARKALPVFDIYSPAVSGVKDNYDIDSASVIDYFAVSLFKDYYGFVKIKD